MKKGILLINLGTPDDCSKKAVRRYLREFLSDRRVITLPTLLRWIILYCFILPFRPKKTASAYRLIWQKEGSPLLIYSENLIKALTAKLPDTYTVALGMRYGSPSIKSGLEKLKDCDSLYILPLFPQYASATTGSAIEAVLQLIKKQDLFPSIHIQRDFYDSPAFIIPMAKIINEHVSDDDHLLLSYHGLPESHLKPMGCKEPCASACEFLNEHPACYRAQCFETSKKIQEILNLPDEKVTTSFQSRLGKTPWIRPYTDEILKELREKGIKNLAVACPAFISDCLETLEEIGIRGKESWQALGGETFKLIPCVNASPAWVDALASFIKD
jgi:ferrochelatase